MIKREELIIACCSDFAGKLRGKAFPAVQLEKRLQRGIGWVPTNVLINCFDVIGASPFGSLGDLVLLPDPATDVRIVFDDHAPPERFMLGNIHHTDGKPWEMCTRSILARAVERLQKIADVQLIGTFEHEFQFRDKVGQRGMAFTLAGYRQERDFCEYLVAVMREAGLSPDTVLREFGDGQYEVTMSPQQGVMIADHAAILKELVHSVASFMGKSVTFTPIRNPKGSGNGVHIHMSMVDGEGKPVTWDGQGRHELSEMAGKFVAGILKYLPDIIAITAPSVVSYLRLTPHRWSAAFNNLGFRDREAAVRICPVSAISDVDRASQFNFEFRAADATASPHLALAALVHAGVQGIEEDLPVPEATQEDLSLLSVDTLKERGLARLPQTLEQALDLFQASEVVKNWFPDGFVNVYVKHKQSELACLEGKSPLDICAAYEEVY